MRKGLFGIFRAERDDITQTADEDEAGKSDAGKDVKSARPASPNVKPTRLERAEWFFTFLVFFAGFFYLTREAKTDLQWYFRVCSIFAGVVGWMVVQVLKRWR